MDGSIIVLGICLIVSIAGNGFLAYFLTKAHAEEKKELHDRLMARDYPEFMQGKDFSLELDKKEKEINSKPIEKPTLSKTDQANMQAAEGF